MGCSGVFVSALAARYGWRSQWQLSRIAQVYFHECKMTCKSTGCSCIKWQVWCECVTEDIAVDSDYDFTDVSLKSLMLLILNSIQSSHFLEPRPLFKFGSIRFLKFIASRISQFPSDYKFAVLPPKTFIFL